jgi:hypothetical protein
VSSKMLLFFSVHGEQFQDGDDLHRRFRAQGDVQQGLSAFGAQGRCNDQELGIGEQFAEFVRHGFG